MAIPAATPDNLFDDSSIHEVRLTLDPNDWQTLQANYLTNDYYKATFQWREFRVENVGIRSRGFGSRNAQKPGLKVDFNEFVSQEFLGLKSIVLDNLVQDPAMMSERLSLALFRRLNLPAPRLAHARLYINENYAGLYTLVEPVDKSFLRRVYGEDKGDLYDYGWNSNYRFEYLGAEKDQYFPVPFEPKTNSSTFAGGSLIEMIRIANEASDEEFAEKIPSYLDVSLFLRYLAVESYTADLDGILGDWGINNFYLYRRPASGVFHFIAWDKDVSFREERRSIFQNVADNVLVRRLLDIPAYREAYFAALEECSTAAGGGQGWLAGELDRTASQINLAALEDPASPFTFDVFSDAVSWLRYFVEVRPAEIEMQIEAARSPVSGATLLRRNQPKVAPQLRHDFSRLPGDFLRRATLGLPVH